MMRFFRGQLKYVNRDKNGIVLQGRTVPFLFFYISDNFEEKEKM